MAIDLVVACPIYARGWVIDQWIDSVLAQDLPPKTRFLFALTPSKDRTEHVIAKRLPDAEIITVEHFPAFTDSERDDVRRYSVLAQVRNLLLRRVAALGPAHYWSLDSDIIMAPDALRELLAVDRDAVGGLIDMGGEQMPGHWSWMHLDEQNVYRPAEGSFSPHLWRRMPPPFEVGVIMACKLMTERAYRNVRYADHIEGEDCGWAIQAEAMGVQRWIAPKARGEHRWRLPESRQPAPPA